MLERVFDHGRQEAVVLLFAGAMGLLGAVVSSTRRLAVSEEPAPAWRALVHWVPIALAALVATGLGRADLAIGIVFGTSVAALSAVIGFQLIVGPLERIPLRVRHLWPFLPVPAVLIFLLGFNGTMGLRDALILAIEGLLALMLWRPDRHDPESSPIINSGTPTVSGGEGEPMLVEPALPRRRRQPAMAMVRGMELMLAWALVGVAAWAATRGSMLLDEVDVRYPAPVIGSTLLSVVLIMPMVTSGLTLAATGKAWAPITAQAGVVLLNLGALLPAIIVVAAARTWQIAGGWAATRPAELAVLYPRVSWRIDAVTLVLLSLLFIPAATRRVRLTRGAGLALIFAYCLYLMYVLVLSVHAPGSMMR